MNKDKLQVGDLVTDKTHDGAEPTEGIGLVIAPHSLIKPDGWMVYWFKYAEIQWWYEYHLTKL